MRATTTLLFAAGAAAATQTTTGNLTTTIFANYLMGFGAPVASIIAADPPSAGGAVTYLLWCGDAYAAENGGSCDWDSPGITLTAGPSTYAWTQAVDPESVTIPISQVVVDCKLEGTTRAVCTRPNDVDVWSGGKYVSRTITETATADTLTGSVMDLMWGPLTVTAGLEKLAAAAAGAAATTTAVDTAAAAAATSSTTSGTGSSSSSTTVVQSTSTSGAAVASRTTDTRISEASNTGTASAAAASSTNGAVRFDLSFAAGAAALLVGIVAL
ncbi:GPI anchored cell wall protein [Lasiodiplodia theobromae]|uniref:GPI anchored cell wall protein n=1 Tax=Lasiodiplodia theobromae TaxID=45133 RepID=UPI0015C3B67E|nr:GPI anchored cell wall protein [Lasiodiplodia theobromae]KAF4540650.1 GPI anchored cell wall protein [Lasiodiplodia theobromae]